MSASTHWHKFDIRWCTLPSLHPNTSFQLWAKRFALVVVRFILSHISQTTILALIEWDFIYEIRKWNRCICIAHQNTWIKYLKSCANRVHSTNRHFLLLLLLLLTCVLFVACYWNWRKISNDSLFVEKKSYDLSQ